MSLLLLLGGGGGTPDPIVDSFDRADSGSLGTADNGHVWNDPFGLFSIVSNAAEATASTTGLALADLLVDTANGRLTFDMVTPSSVSGSSLFMWSFRFIDTNDMWLIFWSMATGNITLGKYVTGAFTSVTTAAGPTLSPSTTYGIEIIYDAGAISLAINTSSIFSVTGQTEFETTGLSIGIGFNDDGSGNTVGTRFDTIRLLPYAPPVLGPPLVVQTAVSGAVTFAPLSFEPGRTVTDGVTTVGSTTLGSASGGFTSADLGMTVTGPGITPGTTIVGIIDSTHVMLSMPALATASGLTISFTTTHLPIEAVVIEEANFDVEVLTLDESWGRTWQEQIDEPGTATVNLQNTDPDLAAITGDRLVQFRLYGQAAVTMKPEKVVQQVIAQGEEHDQFAKITGRLSLSLWEEAVTYPPRGVDQLPIDLDCMFNWTANIPVFDDSAWQPAIELAMQGAATPAWTSQPPSWPDSSAWWIWVYGGTLQLAQPGICYFRKTWTIPAGVTQIAVYLSCDDIVDLYLDGHLILQNTGFTNTAVVFLDVTPGQHTFAAAVTNLPPAADQPAASTPLYYTVVPGDTLWGIATTFYGDGTKWGVIYDANQADIEATAIAHGLWNPYDPGHWIFPGQNFVIPGFDSSGSSPILNPAALLVSCFAANNGKPAGGYLVHTDSTWLCVPYPPGPPGMTVGRVIRVLLEEAQGRGGMLGWSLDFTDTYDSAGNAWQVVTDIGTKVGTDYLALLVKQLVPTYCDIYAHPSKKVLSAWVKGAMGGASGVTYHPPTDPNDESTGNLRSLTITRVL